MNLGGLHQRSMAAFVVALLAVASCSAQGDDSADTAPATTAQPPVTSAAASSTTNAAATDSTVSVATTPTTAAAQDAVMFGDLPSPCGPGTATIADGQNGGPTLKLGVGTDAGASVAPGINQELLDAGNAFAAWCNEQGGIQGLPLEIVHLDGALFNVAPITEQACDEVFALVGGGFTFDDQMFPRFHECGLVNFPGFVVTPTAERADATVEAVPNNVDRRPSTWWEWAASTYPEAVQRTAIMYADFLTSTVVKDQTLQMMEAVGITGVQTIPYSAAGEANWAPFAQTLKDQGITALNYIGGSPTYVLFAQAMEEIGYRPDVILLDANFYDDLMVVDGNAINTVGTRAQTAFGPFQEPENYPAVRDYLAMMDTYNPDGKRALLGEQATSAFLLFAKSANDCLAANDGVLERNCVVAAGKQVTSWTGGGLHAETNPAERTPARCTAIVQVVGDAWQREFPEFGSADDDGNGFHCGDLGIADVTLDYGDTSAGLDPTRGS